MTTCIPQAGGVPGIGTPPNWLPTTPPISRPIVDDPRWRGATRRDYGPGTRADGSFRALYDNSGGVNTLYFSFRVNYTPTIQDQDDLVFLGLQAQGGTTAMVIQMQVHIGTSAMAAGTIGSIQVSTSTNGGTSWSPSGATPTWISQFGRAWLAPGIGLGTNSWAVHLKIPLNNSAATPITANAGPFLGSNFMVWYAMTGYAPVNQSPIVLAENRITYSQYNALKFGNFPAVNTWDTFQFAGSPGCAALSGVALEYFDVGTTNPTDSNINRWPVPNTFVARPRNYTGSTISSGGIQATFQLANWGSNGAVNPNQPWTDPNPPWTYIPGNDVNNPVPSTAAVPSIPANSNPPPGSNPIQLQWPVNASSPNPFAGVPKHQCMLVVLSGAGLTFINDSVYRNMDFTPASLIERAAEINVRPPQRTGPLPTETYIAVEQVNMPANTAPGYSEGKGMETTIKRLIASDDSNDPDSLGNRLRKLGDVMGHQDFDISGQLLNQLLEGLRNFLAGLSYNNRDAGLSALKSLQGSLAMWLAAEKKADNPPAIKNLVGLLMALAAWLRSPDPIAAAKNLAAFIDALTRWLNGLGNDPASRELGPGVLRSLQTWLATLSSEQAEFARLGDVLNRMLEWERSNRAAQNLPALLAALGEWLVALGSSRSNSKIVLSWFAEEVAKWLDGADRMAGLVNGLTEVGILPDEYDQIFPTTRYHVYTPTGEIFTQPDGKKVPVLKPQSSFGFYAYHEGDLQGWQHQLEGAVRIAENFYKIPIPNDGVANIVTHIQAVEPGDTRLPEDPIKPDGGGTQPGPSCLETILGLFGIKLGK